MITNSTFLGKLAKQVEHVFGYGRVSTDRQSISIENQERRCQEWFDLQIQAGTLHENAQWMGYFRDEAITSKIDWLARPMGNKMLGMLKTGDIIVSAIYDRTIRGARDCEISCEILAKVGVKPIFLDQPNVDPSEPSGEFFLAMRASMGRFERRMCGMRTSEAMDYLISQGKPVNRESSIGWRKSGKVFIVFPEERRMAQMIVIMKDVLGVSLEEIIKVNQQKKLFHYLEPMKRALRQKNGTYITREMQGKPWGEHKIQKAYHAAKKGFPKPNGDVMPTE